MDLTQLVQQYLPTDRKSSATGFYVNCPMCMHRGESRPDTKHRGGFTMNADGGWIYHCYNCHFATKWEKDGRVGKNLMFFLTTIGIPPKMVPLRLRLLQFDEKVEAKIDVDEEPEVCLNFDEIRLPHNSRTFEEWVEEDEPPSLFISAFSYMASRGEAVFNGSTYYWTTDTDYGVNQRVIIPFYHHGKIVGYTGRVFTGNSKLRKYYSQQPRDFMYNQELLESDIEIIFLVEGVPDAISINGVGVMGNHLSEKQVNLLRWSKKRIILVPDRDKAGEKLIDQVARLGWEISLITTEWGSGISDCAQATRRFGKLYTLESILNTATKDEMKIKTFKTGLFRLNA